MVGEVLITLVTLGPERQMMLIQCQLRLLGCNFLEKPHEESLCNNVRTWAESGMAKESMSSLYWVSRKLTDLAFTGPSS
jgi:hypothetical protein